MSEELKKQLSVISERLQQIAGSRATCDKLIESGSVHVVDANAKEGQEPVTLSLASSEMIEVVLQPVIKQLDIQKERLLNAKESVLNSLEKEITESKKDELKAKKAKKE